MENQTVKVHKLTNDPTKLWNQLSKFQIAVPVDVALPQHPVKKTDLRIVCISDTHGLTHRLPFHIPDGDLLIHAGDFTRSNIEEVVEFNRWLGTLPHKYKIVIAGNHELVFDTNFTHYFQQSLKQYNVDNVRQLLTNCTYLEDSGVEVCGIYIWGSPWQPIHRNGAFNLNRGHDCLTKWNLIPTHTDILITHGPPLGHGDLVPFKSIRAGCAELLATLQLRLNVKYHIFGHIHEGYGVTTDGRTFYVNASTCDAAYKPRNYPMVFDVPLPCGQTKITN